MTHCTGQAGLFSPVARRRIDVSFDGGAVTSDAGVLLLRQVDRKLGLLEGVAQCLKDPRDSDRGTHSVLHLLRQRVYGLCQGYEDLNDHDTWRLTWPCRRPVSGCRRAPPAPLCRLENRMDRSAALAIHAVLVEQLIASFSTPPDQLILDFNATDDPVYGAQEGRFFHGYWWANQFRLLLASLGYLLLDAFRRLGLAGTDLARAQCSTLRVEFLEIGGVILRNTRCIHFLLPDAYPWQALFWRIAERFAPAR